ncbi:SOLH1 protein, partial [Crocuta crocuta]
SRKRISVSCERLRALLPRFAGRREDMASVLEMSVQFLRLGGGQHQPGALALSEETWHKWQRDILQLALSSPTSAGAPDSGVAVPGATDTASPACPWGVCLPPVPELLVSCAGAVGGGGGLSGRAAPHMGKAHLHLPSLIEPRSLAPWPSDPSPRKALRSPPLWPPRSWQPPSPLGSEEAQSCLGQAGSPMEGAYSGGGPGPQGAGGRSGCRVPASFRLASGDDVEDGTSFLLSTGPDWWLGSLEGRGAGVPTRSAVRSSLLDRAEPSFLADAGPGPQEPLDGPPEPWGPDAGCPGLAPREEVDSIFPDFFAS